MKYQDIRHWKYRTVNNETFQTGIVVEKPIFRPYIMLTPDGWLHVQKGYAWNGCNAIPETRTNLRGSLPHDALYQLFRLGALDIIWREAADDVLRDVWIEDGMPAWLAKSMTQAVRWFGARFAQPDPEREGNLPIKDAP